MHGILIRCGDVVMALFADAATALIGRVFDKALVGIILVFNVFSLMTVDASYLTVYRIDEILGNAESVPAPHLRSRNASTGNSGGTACGCRTIAVHLLQIGVAVDAFAAGGHIISGKRPANADGTCKSQQGSGHHLEPFLTVHSTLLRFYVMVHMSLMILLAIKCAAKKRPAAITKQLVLLWTDAG